MDGFDFGKGKRVAGVDEVGRESLHCVVSV